jgi:hypothetical protein
MPVVRLSITFKLRRVQVAISVAVVVLVGAGLLTAMLKDRGRVSARESGDGRGGSTGTQDPLPVGGLQAGWDLPVGDFYPYAMDRASHSIALIDFAIGPAETTRVEVVDAERGFVRWRREFNAKWLVNSDGSLSVTRKDLGFLVDETSPLYNGSPVYAIRLSDGQIVWRAEPGIGWGPRLVGSSIVLHTATDVTALDAGSGSRSWKWSPSGTCEDGLDLDRGAGMTLVVKCGRTVYGVGLAGGSVKWKWSASDNCLVHQTATSERVVGVVVTCSPAEQQVYVLDRASGAEEWHRAVHWNPAAADPSDPSGGAANVSLATSSAGSVLELDTGSSIESFDALTGKRFPHVERRSAGKVVSAESGSLIYLHEADHFRDPNDVTTVSSVDPRSGSTLWETPLPLASVSYSGETYSLQHGVGHTQYLVGSVEGLWPTVVVLINTRSGDMTASATGWSDSQLVGVGADGTIYVASRPYSNGTLHAFRVTGHASGYLGTRMRGTDWPDACRLFSAAQYRSEFSTEPTVKPVPLKAPGAALPTPSRCRYLPPSIEGTEVTVELNWLTDSAADAAVAAAQQSSLGRKASPATVGAARQRAWRWDETNVGVDRAPRTRLSFAVGRCVASVTALGPSQALERVGGMVADNLANPTVSPGCTT